jgi:tRNA pseudouridine65 synthase
MLKILYSDDDCVAVDKPSGLLVHRSEIDKHEENFAVQILRDQLERRVQPVHRLDKPTSGVLLFALNERSAKSLSEQFEKRSIRKCYLAVVRGHTHGSETIDYPLKQESAWRDKKTKGPPQEAVTLYKTLANLEYKAPVGRYATARFSLIELEPRTGRTHQLRRHLAHIRHPIIGDTRHGDGVQNRFAREHFGADRLWLHASSVEIDHPVTGKRLKIQAPEPEAFQTLYKKLGLVNGSARSETIQ